MSQYYFADMRKKLSSILLLAGIIAFQASAYACFTLDGKCRYAVTFERLISVKSLYSFDNIDIHNVAYLKLDFGNSLNFDSLGIPVSKLQREIKENNKGFITSTTNHNKMLLEANKNKLTPQSLMRPEMRGLAVEIIESQRRIKSFAAK